MLQHLINWDISIFLFLNHLRHPILDVVMVIFSHKFTFIPMYAFFLYLFIREYKAKAWLVVIFVVLSITLSDQLSVHLFKNVFERLRPCHNPMLEGQVFLIDGKCGGQYGFVSSHAANAFAFVGFTMVALFRYMRKGLWLLPIWALIVCYSRIYLGVHYPADVICGSLLGGTIGASLGLFFMNVFFKKFKEKQTTLK